MKPIIFAVEDDDSIRELYDCAFSAEFQIETFERAELLFERLKELWYNRQPGEHPGQHIGVLGQADAVQPGGQAVHGVGQKKFRKILVIPLICGPTACKITVKDLGL